MITTHPVNAFGALAGPGMGAHGRTVVAGWTPPPDPPVVGDLLDEDTRARARCGDPNCDHIWSARLAATTANATAAAGLHLGWLVHSRSQTDMSRGPGLLLIATCRDADAQRCWWEAYADARHGGAAHGLEGLAELPFEGATA